MRVNIYAEEMTDRVEIIKKEGFTGVRFYLELPVTKNGQQISGPFLHHPGDDDSSAVTFWGKTKLKEALQKALSLLESEKEFEILESTTLSLLGSEKEFCDRVFAAAIKDGCTHIIADLSFLEEGFAISKIPQTKAWGKYVVHKVSTLDQAQQWFMKNLTKQSIHFYSHKDLKNGIND